MTLHQDPGRNISEQNPVCIDLIPALPPELERLDGISQGVRAFTELGAGVAYSRLYHSVRVLNVLNELIGDAKLDSKYRQTLELLALFHDVGHVPFSHTGEEALSRLGCPIDHDAVGAELARQPFTEMHNICKSRGIDPEYMAHLMSPGSERSFGEAFLVKEVADRIAYLRDDLRAGSIPQEVRDSLECALQAAKTSIQWGEYEYTLEDPSFLEDILAIREFKHQELILNPANLIAHELVIQELQSLFRQAKMTVDEFLIASEADILANFSVSRRTQLLGRVENYFYVPVSWCIPSKPVVHSVRDVLAAAFLDQPSLFGELVPYAAHHQPKECRVPRGIVSPGELTVFAPGWCARGVLCVAAPIGCGRSTLEQLRVFVERVSETWGIEPMWREDPSVLDNAA